MMKRHLLAIGLLLAGSAVVASELRSVREVLVHNRQKADAAVQVENYSEAIDRYTGLAGLGDKYAMYRLSLLIEQGLGQAADPALAWGWAAVAAEARTPSLVAHADAMWARLDTAQQQRALEEKNRIADRYSDLALLAKKEREVRQLQSEATGSRTGFGSNVIIYDADTGTSENATKYYAKLKETRRRIDAEVAKRTSVDIREESSSDVTESVENNSANKESD